MSKTRLMEMLNGGTAKSRIDALTELVARERAEGDLPNRRVNDANNHIHTIYSFSPYSPTAAAYRAYRAGLTSAGIMDHDSLSGAAEFAAASKILGLGYTTGVETRVKFSRGASRRYNHPDQNDCCYVAAHGVPARNAEKFNVFFAKYRAEREQRDRAMAQLINIRYAKYGLAIDFDTDVYPLSEAASGGSITERHLMKALAVKLENSFGRGEKLITFMTGTLGLAVSEKQRGYLSDAENANFIYDLLGVLKTDTKFFYIEAEDELPTLGEFVEQAKSFGAIPAYAYLGDVGESVTGDKRAQTFEDDVLDDLIPELKHNGVEAIAYMPTRNTPEQLNRLRKLCSEADLFEISGEDINSPRQRFECAALSKPEFANLISATWALIGHERASEKGVDNGMFSARSKAEYPNLSDRVSAFEKIGRDSVK